MNKRQLAGKALQKSAIMGFSSLVVLIGALPLSAANASPVSAFKPLSASISTPISAAAAVSSDATETISASSTSAVSNSSSSVVGTTFTQVLAGTYYSVGLRADGSVWTWGRNLWGELGLPDTTAVSNIAAPVRLSSLSDITSIATSGSGYQLAVKKDGTVWEWGTSYGLSTKTLPPRQLPAVTGVSQVLATNQISFAVMRDGTVWSWTRDPLTGASSEPVQLKGLSKITSLVAAGAAVCALDSSGSVWAVSVKSAENKLTLSVPSRLSGLPVLKQISAFSSDQIFGIDTAGTAWKWSLDMKPNAIKLSAKPSKIHPGLRVKQIQAGAGYAVLVTKQGEVWTYGEKPAGKEGLVKGLNGIVAATAGGYHSLAIDAKGQVWGWGANKWNEVGVQRSTEDGMEYTPKRIQTPVTVTVNGKLLPSSFPSILNNGQVSVPLKDIVKALRAELVIVPASDGTLSYTIKYLQYSATFQAGQAEAEINGKKVALPSKVYPVTGAIMIPASLIKQMGFMMTWDSNLSELKISSQ